MQLRALAAFCVAVSAAASSWFALSSGLSGQYVDALAFFDGAIYAGGTFLVGSSYYIAYWAGAALQWQPLPGGIQDTVNALQVCDGVLYVGADSGMGEKPGVLASSQSVGTALQTVGGRVIGDSVRTLACSPGGTLPMYFGGTFGSANSGTVLLNNVAYWDGTTFHPVGAGLNYEVDACVVWNAMPVCAGDSVLFVSIFESGAWRKLGSDPGNAIIALTVFAGNLVAGGISGVLVQWDSTTSTWSTLGAGADDTVDALAVSGDGSTLYATGLFTSKPGVHVSRWDGSTWSPMGTGLGGKGGATEGFAVAAVGATGMLVGGSFGTAGVVTSQNVAYWGTALPPAPSPPASPSSSTTATETATSSRTASSSATSTATPSVSTTVASSVSPSLEPSASTSLEPSPSTSARASDTPSQTPSKGSSASETPKPSPSPSLAPSYTGSPSPGGVVVPTPSPYTSPSTGAASTTPRAQLSASGSPTASPRGGDAPSGGGGGIAAFKPEVDIVVSVSIGTLVLGLLYCVWQRHGNQFWFRRLSSMFCCCFCRRQHHVMISYRWGVEVDGVFSLQQPVLALAARLRAAGYRVWLDHDHIAAKPDDAPAAMKAGIDSSHAVVIVMEPGYVTRPNCRLEARHVVDTKKPYFLINMGPPGYVPPSGTPAAPAAACGRRGVNRPALPSVEDFAAAGADDADQTRELEQHFARALVGQRLWFDFRTPRAATKGYTDLLTALRSAGAAPSRVQACCGNGCDIGRPAACDVEICHSGGTATPRASQRLHSPAVLPGSITAAPALLPSAASARAVEDWVGRAALPAGAAPAAALAVGASSPGAAPAGAAAAARDVTVTVNQSAQAARGSAARPFRVQAALAAPVEVFANPVAAAAAVAGIAAITSRSSAGARLSSSGASAALDAPSTRFGSPRGAQLSPQRGLLPFVFSSSGLLARADSSGTVGLDGVELRSGSYREAPEHDF